ncbi:MAG: radical SAM family heme chaperone HemW [Planctomycetes bacterium]|nr:radical SAM family heme chaperone HemW [Planctomycetota bacterium]
MGTRRKKLNENGVGLYVHLPFCKSKCRYCDFNSYAWTGQSLQSYVDALLIEAEQRIKGLKPQTVFFGGGTPTFLPADLLSQLLEELNRICGFRASSLETTMEANPESVNEERILAILAGGVNRLSIGIQSLQADVLEAYDRVHSPDQARQALALAQQHFQNFSADLIFAFPGQDPERWRLDLAEVLNFAPNHISCYELSYEPGTALTRLRDVGRWNAEDPDLCEYLFKQTGEQCSAAGYQRYEISNFCQPDHQCLHNLAAWQSFDFIGIGAGAASSMAGTRRHNIERPDAYQAVIENGGDPLSREERPNAETVLFEHMLMGMRLTQQGVSRQRAKRQTGLDPWQEYRDQLVDLGQQGLIHADGDLDQICVTPRGALLLDHILMQFLPSASV